MPVEAPVAKVEGAAALGATVRLTGNECVTAAPRPLRRGRPRQTGANLVDVEHVREGVDLHVGESAVQLVLQTRGRGHAERVSAVVAEAGYAASVVR